MFHVAVRMDGEKRITICVFGYKAHFKGNSSFRKGKETTGIPAWKAEKNSKGNSPKKRNS